MASTNGESEGPSKVYERKSKKGVKRKTSDEFGGSDGGDLREKREVCDDGGGKFGFLGKDNRVTISLASKSKKEVRECRRQLQSELNLVREMMRKIEGKERGKVDRGEVKKKQKRVLSGVEVEDRPLKQLSVSVVENGQAGSDRVKKEKRTPKVNQFYRNSEFLLAKDKIPLVDKDSRGSGKKQGEHGKDKILPVDKESAKKQGGGDLPVDKQSKGSGKKKQGSGDVGSGLGEVKSQFLKTCKGLLQRLMKHKNGWVFNVPVDVNALGLHDYFDIIKAPMDLGTVKSRLDKNFYQDPMEFMVDVRLTFQNAMTYNPKGQDVYVMAEQLLQIFEEKWAVIEADLVRELTLVVEREGRKAHTPQELPVEKLNAFELSTDLVNLGQPGRPAAPKKPKARDPNKREMTYAEKQKLSSNLQALPAEKLENVVDIIRKRNASLHQHDDEIEVDINSFDTETLWELDRFTINYKKNLSKTKRNSELANKAKPAVERRDDNENPAPVMDLLEDTPRETELVESSPVRLENQTINTSQASKSSGSSSNCGSATTDSGSSNSSG